MRIKNVISNLWLKRWLARLPYANQFLQVQQPQPRKRWAKLSEYKANKNGNIIIWPIGNANIRCWMQCDRCAVIAGRATLLTAEPLLTAHRIKRASLISNTCRAKWQNGTHALPLIEYINAVRPLAVMEKLDSQSSQIWSSTAAFIMHVNLQTFDCCLWALLNS